MFPKIEIWLTMSDNDSEWNPVVVADQKKNLSRKKSSVWQFFDPLDDASAMCTICRTKLSYKGSSSNLRKHCKKRHPEITIPKNPIFRANRDNGNNDDRNETQRATSSVMVDYLRPAADEENRFSRFTSVSYSRCSSPVKREKSPEARDFRSKYSRPEETEFEHFARGIVMQLKQLPLVHALEVQSEISNFLFQKRIQALRQNHQTNTDVPMQYAFVYAEPATAAIDNEEISVVTDEKASTEQEENNSVSC